jgi:hypothetical protein
VQISVFGVISDLRRAKTPKNVNIFNSMGIMAGIVPVQYILKYWLLITLRESKLKMLSYELIVYQPSGKERT